MSADLLKFQISSINIEEFATLETNYDEKNEKYYVLVKPSYGIDTESRVIQINIENTFFQKENMPFIILKSQMSFIIEKDAFDSLIVDKVCKIPISLMTHFVALCSSTNRGIIFTKNENTKFRKIILPLLNATKFVKDDIIFVLNEEDS